MTKRGNFYIFFDFERGWRRSSGGRASDSYSLGPGFESLRRYQKIMYLKKFIHNLKNYCLVSPDDSVLIACSGGPDSLFLTYLFYNFLKEEKNAFKKIAILHVNHNYRESSKRDELLVKDLSRTLGFDFFLENIYPVENSENLENFFRNERIKIFRRYIEKMGFTKIALGHTADDLIENFFMRILRGTGIHGLVEMSFVGWNGTIIRPILNFYKDEILKFLKENRIEYALDETNFENSFLRNKLRNLLIPFIKENIDSNFKDKVSHLIDVLRIEDEFNRKYSEKIFRSIAKINDKEVLLNVEKFSKLDIFEKFMVLREVVFFLQGNFKSIYYKNYVELIEFIENGNSGKLKKAGGSNIYFVKEFKSVKVIKGSYENKSGSEHKVVVKSSCEIEFLGEKFKISIVDRSKINKNKNCYFYPVSLSDKIIFRIRERGDILRFKFGKKKLKKFLIEKKIGFTKRDRIIIVCNYKNEIIWIPDLNYKFEIFGKNMYRSFFCMERIKNG